MSARSLGKGLLVCAIVGGAGFMVWRNLQQPIDEVDPAVVQEKEQPPVVLLPEDQNGRRGGLPVIEHPEMTKAIEKLVGSIDQRATNDKCAELIEQRDIPSRLAAPEDYVDSYTHRTKPLEWQVRWNEEYLRTTKDSSTVKKEVDALITKILRQNVNVASKETRLDDVARVKELYDTGTKDPVLLVFWRVNTHLNSVGLLDVCLKVHDNALYSTWFKASAFSEYLRLIKFHFEPSDKRVEIAKYYAKAFAELLSEYGSDPDQLDRCMAREVSAYLGTPRYVRSFVFAEWAKMELPPIDLYLMTYLAADAAEATAWVYRGEGYASEVSSEGWDVFGTQNRRAGLYFTKAWILQPELPYAPRRLIAVSRAGGHELSDRQWFDIATSMDFSHWSPYSSYRWSILSRWGGSDEDMYDFVRELLETNAPQSVVQTYARDTLRWYVEWEKNPDIWTRLETLDLANLVTDQLLEWKKSGKISEAPGESSEWKCGLAWVFPVFVANRMFVEAAPLLREFEGPILTLDDMPRPRDRDFCMSAARAHGLENRKKLSSFEDRFASAFATFTDSELKVWRTTLDELDDTEAACIPYLESRYEFGRVQSAVQKGEQVSLALDSPSHCWECRNGSIVPSASQLEISRAEASGAPTSLASCIGFKSPYTWKAQIKRSGDPEDQLAIVFLERPTDPTAMESPASRQGEVIFDLPTGSVLDVVVSVRDNTATVSVNGKAVKSYEPDFVVPESFTPWIETRGDVVLSDLNVEGHR